MNTKAQRTLEKELYRWPNVHRKVGGANIIYYYVGQRCFATLTEEYLVLSRLTPEDRAILTAEWQAEPCKIGDRVFGFEIQIPFDGDQLSALLPYIRKSYDHAQTWKGV